MIARIALGLFIGVALGLATGCSKSSTTQASFGSSSDSSSSPFRSSSKSSSSGDETDQKEEDDQKEEKPETAFERDVRNHTVGFARTAGEPDLDSFQRGLGAIAEVHGITDWEQFDATYVAIGRGLADSDLDVRSAQQLAVALSSEDYDHLALVRSGFESRHAR